MKKLITFIIILALAVIFIPGLYPKAEAAVIGPEQARIAKFWIGKTYYEVDGQRYNMDVAPYEKNDRTMMPARYLAMSLGIPESNIIWNENTQTVSIERGPYPYQGDKWRTFPPDKRNDYIYMTVGQKGFTVNGYSFLASFDVPPEVVPPGRTMIPYRAVAQALGALVFWDDASQCVTVETWREAPMPTPYTVNKVTVYKNALYADILKTDGTTERVNTESPAMVTDPQDGGYTYDAVEWYKLWGVPDSNILYDPVRGGLAIRGGDSKFTMSDDDNKGKVAAGYIYLYNNDKVAWDSYFNKTSTTSGTTNNIIIKGRFYGGVPVGTATAKIYGKHINGTISQDYSSSTAILTN